MAKIRNTSISVELKVTLELTEQEARALDGIFGYDVEAFLKVFYQRMGKAYVQPHEAGVRSLHATMRSILGKPLQMISDARRGATEALKSAHP